jgi:hypothetical protein
MAKINETEDKKTGQRINKRKGWFCEKIRKIDKPLVNLIKVRVKSKN